MKLTLLIDEQKDRGRFSATLLDEFGGRIGFAGSASPVEAAFEAVQDAFPTPDDDFTLATAIREKWSLKNAEGMVC